MSDYQTLEFNKIINAPVKQVYNAFTSSVAVESWFSDFAEITATEKGRFYAWWDAGHYASGIFTTIEENKHLTFTWRGQGESAETLVDVFFENQDGKTQLTLKHSKLGTSGHWEHSVPAIKSGWEYALDNLEQLYETGLDRRLYERPMLGIFPSQMVDEDIAQKLGLPVNTGVVISGTAEGFGAEAVGMQADDVIFSLNKRELVTFSDFAPAIAGKKAGDVVEVIFYRGAEKHTVDMTLSGRPKPEIPATAKELAEEVARAYQEVNTELEQAFEGVTEDQAAARPEPKEWSAKETLVHLIYTERWLHLSISCSVSNQRMGGFINQLELIEAMANTYTFEELIWEVKRSSEVTVAQLAALPDDFVADKRRYVGFAGNFSGGFSDHTRSHLPQIKAAIEAAKKN